jgi:hypothetical protein
MNSPVLKIDTELLRVLYEESGIDQISYAVKKKQA